MSYRKGFRKSHDDAIRAPCVAALKKRGAQVYKLDGAKRDHPGIPDDLVVWGGGWCLMEFKAEGEDLNENQQRFWREWRGPPGTLKLVRSPEQALAATGVRVRGSAPLRMLG
jgi:hypothetical protein